MSTRKERDDITVKLSRRLRTIDTAKGTIFLLGTVKGLVSEKEIVRKAIEDLDPDAIALHISIEEIRGIEKVVKGKVKTTYLSSYEKVYARELTRFGEVQIPPPSLIEAYELSRAREIPLKQLDFSDNSYSDIYTKHVNGISMIRQSLRQKRVNRKKFRSNTPEEFCMEWDSVVNKLKAYRMLEESRERKMGDRIININKKYPDVLAIVEIERVQGIRRRIEMILSERT
ncbi:MAG: hypothetical protein U9R75_05415 [Candidatus Thermoplasmatota archaeon]|nr:hypothetical protein [Candidatus Thermoplasmatota archaeon]